MVEPFGPCIDGLWNFAKLKDSPATQGCTSMFIILPVGDVELRYADAVMVGGPVSASGSAGIVTVVVLVMSALA